MRSRLTVVLGIVAILIPVTAAIAWRYLPALGTIETSSNRGSVYPPSKRVFEKSVVGPAPAGHPRIANVQIASLHKDDVRPGVIACDVARNQVIYHRQSETGQWTDEVLVSDVSAPSHATVVDIDQDADQDVVVSVLGNIEPDDGVVGRLILLKREAETWQPQVLLDEVRRVADAQPGDFDADGDIDLAVAVFGYNRGAVLWLENLGDGRFLDHELHSGPGVIHVPVADFDGDGDLDIAAPVTQDEEEVWGFENLGSGQFRSRKLWYSNNFDLGSAGLLSSDLDGDGDQDILLPVGDNLEDLDPFPQPYHGCLLLRNDGNWTFTMKRISSLGGTYAAGCGDLDADGDVDVALVSMANVWDEPERAAIVWLENKGNLEFEHWQIDSAPTHLITVAVGDLDGNGLADLVAGGLHIRGPYNRLGRVTAWHNSGTSDRSAKSP